MNYVQFNFAITDLQDGLLLISDIRSSYLIFQIEIIEVI